MHHSQMLDRSTEFTIVRIFCFLVQFLFLFITLQLPLLIIHYERLRSSTNLAPQQAQSIYP